ncbi:hypothetical protein [Mucilaginibacter agri]|uniref:Signal transduction histidine kinase dimerisation/phosphoacceptor domain-containing protein n=1 Tax=Mucilaginibacter agri TaxID=2695265 RepID=A0A965ZE75_9SPHI|nr:hypothetical protein [Mucilaginibacter agri]NCD69423.1 hypothetical protein [Mucilaginibacter agri]
MADDNGKSGSEKTGLAMVKHDIRNQLSNMTLCVEQLRFELPDVSDDILFYIDTIAAGCVKINELLKKTDEQRL